MTGRPGRLSIDRREALFQTGTFAAVLRFRPPTDRAGRSSNQNE